MGVLWTFQTIKILMTSSSDVGWISLKWSINTPIRSIWGIADFLPEAPEYEFPHHKSWFRRSISIVMASIPEFYEVLNEGHNFLSELLYDNNIKTAPICLYMAWDSEESISQSFIS